MVLADSLKRWHALSGDPRKRALLCTGTDEHGMKVQRAAEREEDPADRHPKKFADKNAAAFLRLARDADLAHDRFIRTTDPDHAAAVQHFWRQLRDRGYIYESKHQGWYSVGDECFVPEATLVHRLDPLTGKAFAAAGESGHPVEWVEEKNYLFRMTALRDRLLHFYEQNPGWITPATRMNEVVSWVTNSLADLSISRPRSRLSWGIEVPDDATQTVFVWVDALVNYLTMAGYPNWAPGHEHQGGWPADLHVIGKDILRFHCVYWPALLLALDLPLPKRVLSHAHWTMNHKKMSKSVGNVVDPFLALERFGVDTMRFYLIHGGSNTQDSDYANTYIVDRYQTLLQDKLGNLASRTVRTKLWNLGKVVRRVSEGAMHDIASSGQVYSDQLLLLEELPSTVARHMDSLDPGAALRHISQAIIKVSSTRGADRQGGLN